METDDDFHLALKLSMELNGHDSLRILANFPSSSKTDSSLNLSENRKRSIELNDYSQPSKKFTVADEDYQLALKLSEELNSQPSTSNANEDYLLALKLVKESPSCDEIKFDDENDDFLLAIRLAEDLNSEIVAEKSISPIQENSSQCSKSANESNEKSHSDGIIPVEEYEWDDKDDDFLLAIKLSREDYDPKSNVEKSTPSTSSSVDSNLTKLSSDRNRENPNNSALTIDEFSWDDEDDEDFLLAVKLSQEDYDPKDIVGLNKSKISNSVNENNVRNYSDRTISVVDPSWETIDPNPDIYSLFTAFNQQFFWGKLDSVEVKWSPRMTLCAGICSYSPRAGFCSVRLSKPLLQYRPRKDLVETLLHEMIHAFLFVTRNDRDRDGHGPRFHSHMYRINKETGANITVYHSFHEEVKMYKTHWWRCEGPCQHKPPYYGYVKRSTNRAPAPNDLWWNDHRASCGGNFIKVREPADYKNKKLKKSDGNKPKANNLNNYFHSKSSTSSASTSSSVSVTPYTSHVGFGKTNTTGTTVTSSSVTNSSVRGKQILNMVNFNSNTGGITSNQKTESPAKKHWAPLPGQKNIFQFINKS